VAHDLALVTLADVKKLERCFVVGVNYDAAARELILTMETPDEIRWVFAVRPIATSEHHGPVTVTSLGLQMRSAPIAAPPLDNGPKV